MLILQRIQHRFMLYTQNGLQEFIVGSVHNKTCINKIIVHTIIVMCIWWET